MGTMQRPIHDHSSHAATYLQYFLSPVTLIREQSPQESLGRGEFAVVIVDRLIKLLKELATANSTSNKSPFSVQ
jgi:hypothetical protein